MIDLKERQSLYGNECCGYIACNSKNTPSTHTAWAHRLLNNAQQHLQLQLLSIHLRQLPWTHIVSGNPGGKKQGFGLSVCTLS